MQEQELSDILSLENIPGILTQVSSGSDIIISIAPDPQNARKQVLGLSYLRTLYMLISNNEGYERDIHFEIKPIIGKIDYKESVKMLDDYIEEDIKQDIIEEYKKANKNQKDIQYLTFIEYLTVNFKKLKVQKR